MTVGSVAKWPCELTRPVAGFSLAGAVTGGKR